MADHDKLKEWMESRRADLTRRLSSIKQDVTRRASADWSEQAQERENDEVIDALGNEAEAELNLINKALDRMANDDFGFCEGCGGDIAEARLTAMPYADLCITCAEKRDVAS
ncbi:dimethylmenaquinone methyltransferase [Endozoicomonas sp. OPT23]|uniref:TraR/DksA family transcriptional regulator n=1 Tax=Endozoicomonas sp. OPT23 TaxID=2072845 RepID=UPI00129AC23E|nr:TraR/DksA family transcriptional regulator [Endozoicomonas sp. OPT23]MRI35427.1 dimethylmenaquinone methyltransferase [Endozoicomonas sp. OPT23]